MTDRLAELAYHTGWLTALLTDEQLEAEMLEAGLVKPKDFAKAQEALRPIIQSFYRR